VAIGYILFELNFGRYLWKGNLTVKIELPKLDNFLNKLRKSWEIAKNSIEIAKEVIKRQFNKKRQNTQELKQGGNV